MGKLKDNELFIQVTAGRGPVECCWVVAQTLKKIVDIAKSQKVDFEIIHSAPGAEAGTLFSAVIYLKGKFDLSLFSEWEGTIQWIGKSHYRKFHKRKNWFIGANLIAPNRLAKWSEKDFEYQVFKASGPGGQHRNKVESAVRLVHKPIRCNRYGK